MIDAELAPIVKQIDHDGLYPAQAMRALGGAGLFSRHLRAHNPTPSIGAAIDAMAAVGETCMSTAFCTWCQDASGWYLEQSDNAALRERLQADLAHGAQMGGTGLSNPMKSLSGIEKFKLRGRRMPGGYEVSGVLPWVSNLGDGHLFGTVFEDADDSSHRIMAMIRCGQPGVDIKMNARFVALEGTGTYSVLFRRAFIADEMLLADPLGDMVRRIKAGFILLQTGMGLGVTQACIGLMREADVTHGHSNKFLPRRADDFAADLAELRADIATLAATPLEQAPEYLRAVLTARLRVSELTLEAGQAALLHTGARGYIEGSAVNRRIREGHFVAIITPSIRHLRQELSRPELRVTQGTVH
ncbi:MAG: acyl-CoA/acyl-ACP dehydrogenase [Gemmatimonadaceae bacterium]|nr:acyl-CoA/acyl-ACP dehydrogenase [Acetobacteraceae bacterium]